MLKNYLFWNSKYPIARNVVDGIQVLKDIPNTSSISASFNEYRILPGIREIPMSDFDGPRSVFYAADDFARSKELAIEIKEAKQITPLIIAVEEEPYILEGAHRYVALWYLGAISFPALVVISEK